MQSAEIYQLKRAVTCVITQKAFVKGQCVSLFANGKQQIHEDCTHHSIKGAFCFIMSCCTVCKVSAAAAYQAHYGNTQLRVITELLLQLQGCFKSNKTMNGLLEGF